MVEDDLIVDAEDQDELQQTLDPNLPVAQQVHPSEEKKYCDSRLTCEQLGRFCVNANGKFSADPVKNDTGEVVGYAGSCEYEPASKSDAEGEDPIFDLNGDVSQQPLDPNLPVAEQVHPSKNTMSCHSWEECRRMVGQCANLDGNFNSGPVKDEAGNVTGYKGTCEWTPDPKEQW